MKVLPFITTGLAILSGEKRERRTDDEQNCGPVNFMSAFEFTGTLPPDGKETMYPDVDLELNQIFDLTCCTESLANAFFNNKGLDPAFNPIFSGRQIATASSIENSIQLFCDAEKASGPESSDYSVNQPNEGSINLSSTRHDFKHV